MHIDLALRGPDPIIFPVLAGQGGMPIVEDAGLPLDAAEVGAPLAADFGPGNGQARVEGAPWEGDFYGPAVVFITALIERAAQIDCGLDAGNLPAAVGFAALAVGLVEVEIPSGIEGVDLELKVAGGAGQWLEEDLEVVVVEDERVVLGESGSYVWLFELCSDVEIVVVPEHFHAGAKARLGLGGALDVDEVGCPGSGFPSGVVQLA